MEPSPETFFLLLMGGASGNGQKTTQERKATPIKTFHTTVAFKRIIANIAATDSVKSVKLLQALHQKSSDVPDITSKGDFFSTQRSI